MPRCPACGRDYPKEVAICIPCGVDIASGRALDSVVTEETEAPAPRPTVFAWIVALFPGLFRIATLLAIVAALCLAGLVFFIGLNMFALFLWIEAFMVCGLAMVIYLQALVWLQTGQFVLLHNGLIEYQTVQWAVFVLGALAPTTVALALAAHYAK